MYSRILLAYDGSPASERALEQGIRLATALQAEVTIATVAEPLPGYYQIAATVAPGFLEQSREEAMRRLSGIQARAKQLSEEHGLQTKTVLVEAEEVTGLIEIAELQRPDLLIIGFHRHSSYLERAGTVRRIANQARCPLLAVPEWNPSTET